MSYGLKPDSLGRSVGPDLGPNKVIIFFVLNLLDIIVIFGDHTLRHCHKRLGSTHKASVDMAGVLRVNICQDFKLYFLLNLSYTQKKKFSQYLCFLIKSTILHISLSFFDLSCIIVTLHFPFHCVTNNASIRLYQPNFKMHDVHVLRLIGRVIFSYTVRY